MIFNRTIQHVKTYFLSSMKNNLSRVCIELLVWLRCLYRKISLVPKVILVCFLAKSFEYLEIFFFSLKHSYRYNNNNTESYNFCFFVFPSFTRNGKMWFDMNFSLHLKTQHNFLFPFYISRIFLSDFTSPSSRFDSFRILQWKFYNLLLIFRKLNSLFKFKEILIGDKYFLSLRIVFLLFFKLFFNKKTFRCLLYLWIFLDISKILHKTRNNPLTDCCLSKLIRLLLENENRKN